MKELENWYDQISNFERLKLEKAKELYIKAINEKDELIKKEYMERLITGTLYVVYNFIKKQGFNILKSSSYDMNDIINTFNEVWINMIYNGELLNVDRYSLLFSTTTINKVYDILHSNQLTFNERFYISYDCIKECFIEYIQSIRNETECDFSKLVEKYYNGNEYIYKSLIQMIPIFDALSKNIDFDNIRNSKINKYFKFIFETGLTEPLNVNIEDDSNIERRIIMSIISDDFIKEVDLSLKKEKQRQVIHERFGLDDNNPLTLKEVAAIHGITSERVRQIEIKALRKLSRDRNIRKYKGEWVC